MSTPQPHIHELGALDPVAAFTQVGGAFIRLVEGLRTYPEALPPHETLRAAGIAVDTLRAIVGMTTGSLMEMLKQVIDDEVWSDVRIQYLTEKEARTPEEQQAYEVGLIRAISTFTPYETPFSPEDDDNTPE